METSSSTAHPQGVTPITTALPPSRLNYAEPVFVLDAEGEVLSVLGAIRYGDRRYIHLKNRTLAQAFDTPVARQLMGQLRYVLHCQAPHTDELLLPLLEEQPPQWYLSQFVPLPPDEHHQHPWILWKPVHVHPLRQQQEVAEAARLIDPLTGLANTAYLTRQIHIERRQYLAIAQPFALAVLDIRHLETLTEELGVAARHACLIQTATHLRHQLDSRHTLARLDNDQLALLMPETTALQAHALLQSLQLAVHRYPGPVGALRMGVVASSQTGYITGPDAPERLLALARKFMKDTWT